MEAEDIIPLLIIGILLIVLGVYLWAGALFQTKIDSHIAENRLKNLYGREYVEYCRRVNRCIP